MFGMPSWKSHPAPSAKLELHLFVHELTGLPASTCQKSDRTLAVQVDWKGNGPRIGFPLRGAKRSHTAARAAGDDGVVSWREGFQHTCKLRTAATTAAGNIKYRSWIVNLVIQGHGFRSGGVAVIGKVTLDVSTYVQDRGQTMTVPLWCFVDGEAARAALMVTLEFLDSGRKTTEKGPPSTLLRALSLRSFSRRGFSSKIHQKSGNETSSRFSHSHTTSFSDLSNEYPSHRRLPSESVKPAPAALLRALSWSNLSSSFRKASSAGQRMDKQNEFVPKNTPCNEQHAAASCSTTTAQCDAGFDSLQSLLNQETRGLTAQTNDFGRWERHTIRSRNGQMELTTDVFFASIDQRSEAAAGEGACAVLVTVIADWLHTNTGRLPNLPQLDELIRQGSSEWRRLCEDDSYHSRFVDAHFDLETVMEARVRPVKVVNDMSYVGFFRLPTTTPGSSPDDYLLGTLPFEIVWDEATRSLGTGEERTYVVGWNDHFFILKVTPNAVFIIDTLGERLWEGCDRAYILRFDKDSVISKPSEEDQSPGMVAGREFIKEFLAAVPLRELQEEMINGAVSPDSNLLRRMQIEFHYTISGREFI